MNDLKVIENYRKDTGDYTTPKTELLTDLQVMRNLAHAILKEECEEKRNATNGSRLETSRK